MKKYDIILFDLDGTVTDPKEGITNSVAHSLRSYGIEVEDKNQLCKFIGPPLYDSYMKYYGFSEQKAVEAVERYREYYSVRGIYECLLYPYMETLLKNLNNAGKKVVIATSKPEIFAKKVLEYFSVDKYFHRIAGATLDGHRIDKADIIKYAFENMHIKDMSKTVMIGDRNFDVLGAKAFGMDSIGVTYGYGSREELVEAGATYICEKVEEIEKLLL